MNFILMFSFCVFVSLTHPSSEMTIYILEKSVMGGARHLLASDVFMFLQNDSRKVVNVITIT